MTFVLDDPVTRIFRAVERILAEIPASEEPRADNPDVRARDLTTAAGFRAAGISGTMALPPGPLGFVTILPDLVAIWRLQAQLVSDIASVFGKNGKLTEEAMLYCLFRHAAAQAIRDLIVRVGDRAVVRRAPLILQRVLRAIGVETTQRLAGRGIARLLPLVGAVAVAGYAYYDTTQVGHTAVEFFSQNIEVENYRDS
ncbi:MAG: hypothetical protein HY695_20980 [Deltaproteobacteria bacterium]|nr:hypothetical protein [Deltaproteobacteria bacterium]